ncbi:MAG: polysaccharide biosynthesis protein [Acidimicrobiia bacterium]|nr:polysaccharide biosynthesis protein [Acidimicrobiia bacterium]
MTRSHARTDTRLRGFFSSVAIRSARIRSDLPLVAIDCAAVAGAYALALLALSTARGSLARTVPDSPGELLLVAVAAQLAVNLALGLYRQMWRHPGFEEARRIVVAGAVGAALVLAYTLAFWSFVPKASILLGAGLQTALSLTVRFQSRLFGFRRSGRSTEVTRAIVIGAGEAGEGVVRSMLRDTECGLKPVAILDDDRAKQGRRLANVEVMGRIDELVAVAARTHAAIAVFAIADTTRLEDCLAFAEDAGIALKIVPTLREIMSGSAQIGDVRDITMDDLLDRPPVQTDMSGVRDAIRGRRVLVTGAGGSIGSEICRQLATHDPERIILLDRDETLLHDAVTSMSEAEVTLVPMLTDLRDRDAVAEAFERHQPDVVFHAGALKHVPLLESYPVEALRTNVFGTRNVVDAAIATGVAEFVFISTDKAVRPISVMGATKRLGEMLAVSRDNDGTRFCAVRFGNVLGSRGSVIPTFARQIADGGPVTVTDARMERYFMTIPEAVQLVLQASSLSSGGEIFMLDMGTPVRIIDVAKRMIRLSKRVVGRDIPIHVVGVRPGERLQEELHAPAEKEEATTHPKIFRVSGPLPSAELVDNVIDHLDVLSGERAPLRAATCLMEFVSSDTPTISVVSDVPEDVATDNEMIR